MIPQVQTQDKNTPYQTNVVAASPVFTWTELYLIPSTDAAAAANAMCCHVAAMYSPILLAKLMIAATVEIAREG